MGRGEARATLGPPDSPQAPRPLIRCTTEAFPLHDNDLDGLPLELAAFLDFYAQRKERMRLRLSKDARYRRARQHAGEQSDFGMTLSATSAEET